MESITLPEPKLKELIADAYAEGFSKGVIGDIKSTYSVREVMRVLDVSKNMVYNLIKGGMLEPVRLGSKINVTKKSLKRIQTPQ